MKGKDPFALLGLTRTAEDADIRRRYRELARKYHPDHHASNPEAAARFQEISWAYNQIGKPEKRQKYLSKIQAQSEIKKETGDNFRNYFHREGDENAVPRKGGDVLVEEPISFRESFMGKTSIVTVRSEQLCEHCGGSGAAPGSIPYPCQACSGRGEHTVGRLSKSCITCSGSGMIIEHPCQECYEGHVVKDKVHEVQIPAGVRDGHEIKISGAGSAGWAQAGDVIVKVKVAPSNIFQILPEEGALQVEVPINYTEAVLGGRVHVPTPDPDRGAIVINVEPGTISGKKLRLPGQGMPIAGEQRRGHLYVLLLIHTPQHMELDEKQRRLMVELQAHEDKNIRQNLLDSARLEN